MALRTHTLDARLGAILRSVEALRQAHSPALDRWRADVEALRFHLRDVDTRPMLTAILGGTGAGKSTLLNRLLDAEISATSFRRTFTSGAVAVARDAAAVPADFPGVAHVVATQVDLPARGRPDALMIVPARSALTDDITPIDTPDLDGDQPAHHTQADRVFRWADAALFVVTPEKYQMTELLPYYRLARRYAIPALFAMNKVEEGEALEDFRRQLADRDWKDARLFAIPRDDAAHEPDPSINLDALRAALGALRPPPAAARDAGLGARAGDLLGRFDDQILSPFRQDRRDILRLTGALRALETPQGGVDVNPITAQLQRRLQQRSVLYLMGPGRMFERVRQAPSLLARLPRTLWDVVVRGKSVSIDIDRPDSQAASAPDFPAALRDQFAVVQSRMDDALRSNATAGRWLEDPALGYAATRIDPADAGAIATQELDELRAWLEKRWNATPRDTALLMRVLRHMPGGERIAKWTEGAPYLLALIVATHHALFGPFDLMVVGSFSLATWLIEKLSNEVANRTRAANRAIATRFDALAHDQIERVLKWLSERAPPDAALDELEKQVNDAAAVGGNPGDNHPAAQAIDDANVQA
jgi:hypothetical protein